MKILTLAMETQRYDLAAHAVVLSAAKVLDAQKNGAKADDTKTEEAPRRAKGQPERP